jgi:hypothetical protein
MSLLGRAILDIEQALKTSPSLRRLSNKAKKALYTDLALVGFALRYLSPIYPGSSTSESMRKDRVSGRLLCTQEPGGRVLGDPATSSAGQALSL